MTWVRWDQALALHEKGGLNIGLLSQKWNLGSDGTFSVASTRTHIDLSLIPSSDISTTLIKDLPRKSIVSHRKNTHTHTISTQCLPHTSPLHLLFSFFLPRTSSTHTRLDSQNCDGDYAVKDGCFREKVEGPANSRMEGLLYQLHAHEKESRKSRAIFSPDLGRRT
nr:hypothetical protein [Tanacetum cinerariifolium]